MVVHLMLLRSGGGSCEVLAEGHDCVHGILVVNEGQSTILHEGRL